LSQHRRRADAKSRAPRRVSVLLVTTVTALAAIAGGVFVERWLQAPHGAEPAAIALAGIASSRSAALLEQERQRMILMDAASRTLNVVGAPKLATAPASASDQASGPPALTFLPADPTAAQAIAISLMPSYGFSPSTQFSCLNDIWTRESDWIYDAENASGAYGIPQALPGSKMASAGPDWETDPTTQIKWGLGYIQSTYGTPCDAWAFWEAHGWY
jgi:hypothetical protein